MPELGVPPERTVFVSGIGCAGRFVYYMDTYGVHGIHGRATALATGLATARPDLSIWVVTGDGDALSIGGNHLIHALRRNVPIKILLFNNQIYGLTKGQYSPTSEIGKVTKSTPFGSQDHPFNPLALALGAEATFVARTVDTDRAHVAEVLRAAAEHKGSSFVEIYQNCNVFNDGAFDAVRDKNQQAANQIPLEHGKPIRFGENLRARRRARRDGSAADRRRRRGRRGGRWSCTTRTGPTRASRSRSPTSPSGRPARRRSASSATSSARPTARSWAASSKRRASRSPTTDLEALLHAGDTWTRGVTRAPLVRLALQQLLRRRRRIELALHDLVEQLAHPLVAVQRLARALRRRRTVARPSTSFMRLRRRRSASVPAPADVVVVGVDRRGELLHSLRLGRLGAQHRARPNRSAGRAPARR